MREYHIPSGKNQGVYKYYENEAEFRSDFGDSIEFYTWASFDPITLPDNVYIKAEDGYIVPLFAKRLLTNKYKQETMTFSFPSGSVYCYKLKNGQWKFSRFVAAVSEIFTGRLQKRINRTEGFDEAKKLLFANLIVCGCPYPRALAIVLRKKNLMGITKITSRINYLLEDPIVMAKLKEEFTDLSKLVDEEFTDAILLKDLKEGLAAVRKGTKEHLQYLEMIMGFKRKANPLTGSPKHDDTPPV